MKLFISADIEGIGGVASWEHARTKGADYERARRWMTDEVNTAIEGAIEGGATEIVVRDAHGSARNIMWEALHPKAHLISGWGPMSDMLQGIDESFGLVMLIGYHPGPATPGGVLAHSFTKRILALRLNGMPCNETVVAALQAGDMGVPIGLVTGQVELAEEIRPALPDCPLVTTKRGMFHQAALLEPLPTVRSRIRDGARDAVARRTAGGGPGPFQPAPPIRFDLELSTVEAAAALEGIEGIERVSASGCVISAEETTLAIRRFFLAMAILYALRDLP
jgi:D-amino peptidase